MPSDRNVATEVKRRYKTKQISFRRKHDTFLNLVNAEVREDIVKETYKALGQAYELLDKSYDDYSDLVNKTTRVAESGYLEELVKLYSEAQVTYS